MLLSKCKPLVASSAFTMIVMGTGIAHADENNQSKVAQNSQDDIIISYGTRQKRTNTIPYAIHILDAANLERNLPRTLPESLSALPSVMVQKTAAGHGSPYIRGFTGNRTLAVIDGIRYNNATYRDGANEYFSQIDTFTLDQIELLSGPASVFYGSEAVGGTISLNTKNSDFLQAIDNQNFLNGKQILRMSSGDNSIVSNTSLNFGEGQEWGVRVGASIKKYGDIRAAQLGRLPRTGYGETAWDIRFDTTLSDNWTFTLNHQNLKQDDVWRTHSTRFSLPFAGTTIGSDLVRFKDHERSLNYVKLKGSQISTIVNTAEITLSHQSRTEEEQRIRSDLRAINQSFSSDLYAFNSVFTSELRGIDLVYGLDVSHENIDSNRIDTDTIANIITPRIQGPVGDDASYQQAGVFLQSLYTVTDEVDIEVGGRISNIRANIGQFEDPFSHDAVSFKNDWSDVSLSGRINYVWSEDGFQNITSQSKVWLAINQSFRAPNIADISRFGRSRSNEFEVASFDLDPEKFVTGEFGYRLMRDTFKVTGSYYYTDMRNYIDTIPTGRIVDGLFEVSKRNSASGYIQGVEITSSYDITDELTFDSNASWTKGRITRAVLGGTITEPISRIMPLTANLSLEWDGSTSAMAKMLSLSEFWLRAELQHITRANKLSAGDKNDTQRIPVDGTPAYTLINLKTGWEIGKGLDITMSANNLLNTAYRVHGSGSNEPARHLTLGLSASF